MVNDSSYLKFIEQALELAKDIPKYFSKYSNKIFCNKQKIILLVLKQKLRTTYRGLIEILKTTEALVSAIDLKRIPHHSTLVKFAKKLKANLLNLLLPYRKAKVVAVDATGFELESKSYYYRRLQNSDKKQKTKRFMKLSITADIDKQLILAHKIRKNNKRCNIEFRDMLRDLNIRYVIADKGYDSKQNRQFVIKNNAIPIIPVKRHSNFYGYLRSRKKINGNIYHQRSKIETIFSCIKRKYGSCLKARTCESQKKELICKLIAYNVDRLITLYKIILLGFQQSPFAIELYYYI